MTKTEALLREAREIAWRAFEDPSQETIMNVFVRLCDERDQIPAEGTAAEPVTIH